MGVSFGGWDEKTMWMVTVVENKWEKVTRNRDCTGLCLDKRQLNEQCSVRLGVRDVVRGSILFRSADLAMGRDGWKWIIIVRYIIMNTIVIDHIDQVKIDLLNLPMKNPHALNFIPYGLFNLSAIIKVEEGKRTPSDPNVQVFTMFESMNPIIPCAFHWFSTSTVNFVRLVGLLKILTINSWKTTDIVANKQTIKSECDNYVKSVIPDLRIWRNKVSAHFSPTDPYNSDNFGTLEQSIMNNVCFQENRFRVNVGLLTINGETSELPCWSVTETYEQLASRYWPESRLEIDIQKSVRPHWHNFIPSV